MFGHRFVVSSSLACVLVVVGCNRAQDANTASSSADFTVCSIPSTGVIAVDTTWSGCTASLTNVKVAAGATLHIAGSRLYYDSGGPPQKHLLDVEGVLDVKDTAWVPTSTGQFDMDWGSSERHPRWYRGEFFTIALHGSGNRFEHVTLGLGMEVDFVGSSNNVLHDVTVEGMLDPNRGEHPEEAPPRPVALSFSGGAANTLEHVRLGRDGAATVSVADGALAVDDAFLGHAASPCVAASGAANVTINHSLLGGAWSASRARPRTWSFKTRSSSTTRSASRPSVTRALLQRPSVSTS